MLYEDEMLICMLWLRVCTICLMHLCMMARSSSYVATLCRIFCTLRTVAEFCHLMQCRFSNL